MDVVVLLFADRESADSFSSVRIIEASLLFIIVALESFFVVSKDPLVVVVLCTSSSFVGTTRRRLKPKNDGLKVSGVMDVVASSVVSVLVSVSDAVSFLSASLIDAGAVVIVTLETFFVVSLD